MSDQAGLGYRSRIRVGVADDHAITRRALSEFLADGGEFEVVGTACSGREAMELARLVPMDVLLLDIDMPGQSGMDVLPHIVARSKSPQVLMLSTHPPSSYGLAMIRKGAAGYLNKQCDPEDIGRAIRVVASGRKYLDSELSLLLLNDAYPQAAPRLHEKLNEREFQIFLRFARGQPTEEVAKDLSLTPKTVSTYRVKLMEKIQARTNSDLTYYAVKHKLIE